MIQKAIKRLSLRALIINDELGEPTAEGRATRAIVQELQGRGVDVVEAVSPEDAMSVVVSDSAMHAVLLDWTLGHDQNHTRARRLLEFVRARNDKIPLFLMAERDEASSIPIDVMGMVNEYIWTLEDTAVFVGGRVSAAMGRYLQGLLPPLAAALMRLGQTYEVLMAHTRSHRRHRVSQISGRPDLLRLLR